MTFPSSDTLHGKLVLEARVDGLKRLVELEQGVRRELVEHVHSLETRIIALENTAAA